MLSATLSSGLARYNIGAKVHALRAGKDLGLVDLGKHTGLSPAMLSRIERGQLFPTLPTLLRIALVFGVGLEHFFAEDKRRARAVVRQRDRVRLPNRPGAKSPAYFFESLDFPVNDRRMEGYLAVFPPGAKPSEPHSHRGAELIFVTAGRVAVQVEIEETTLAEGDSFYFDSAAPHSYRCEGGGTAIAIVVVVPEKAAR
jgi:quercetin dioxygenase-like cupin family protein/DNA-binding XRE family transcriptional regulator